ncbi:MAG: hypothetical protein Q8S33_07345 [Myxococcales bacterium]|nr:hypothetical protein [Myxococcales bacterium]MDP3500128.1 hypothetical protein [Myxococcales bacterium]
MSRKLSIVVALAFASSCALSVTDYSTTCSVDADCVAVYFGPMCRACDPRCSNDAISRLSKPQYETDASELASACPRPIFPPQCPVFVRSPCDDLERAPVCRAGLCRLP